MKKWILVGLMSILLPLNVNALSGSVSLKCNKTTLYLNETTTCTLIGYSSEEVSALSARLNASGNISVSDISTASIWQGDGSDGDIQLYTDNNKNGSFNIATFKVKASSNVGSGKISVTSVNFTDANFMEHSISSNSLEISVEEEKVVESEKPVTPPIDSSSTNNKEEKPKQEENNTVAPNKKQEQSTTVKNEEKKDDDATLKSIVLSAGNIEFDSSKLVYDIEVSNNVGEILLEAVASSDKANIEAPDKLILQLGMNTFEIKVVAESGLEQIYKLNINRLDRVLSSDSLLENLIIEGYEFDFKKNVFVYEIGEVKNKFLNIETISSDEKSQIEIYGNDNLTENDAIVIKVTAEDGSSSQYILYVSNVSSNIIISIIIVSCLLGISLIVNIIFTIKKIKERKVLTV